MAGAASALTLSLKTFLVSRLVWLGKREHPHSCWSLGAIFFLFPAGFALEGVNAVGLGTNITGGGEGAFCPLSEPLPYLESFFLALLGVVDFLS